MQHYARESGATIEQGRAATGIVVQDGRITGVETPVGRIDTDTVVNAAGMFAPAIGRLHEKASARVDEQGRHERLDLVLAEQVEGARVGLSINQGLFGHGSAVIVSR